MVKLNCELEHNRQLEQNMSLKVNMSYIMKKRNVYGIYFRCFGKSR